VFDAKFDAFLPSGLAGDCFIQSSFTYKTRSELRSCFSGMVKEIESFFDWAICFFPEQFERLMPA
jgi:hypothetical protein